MSIVETDISDENIMVMMHDTSFGEIVEEIYKKVPK
jgi:hypothetical protein